MHAGIATGLTRRPAAVCMAAFLAIATAGCSAGSDATGLAGPELAKAAPRSLSIGGASGEFGEVEPGHSVTQTFDITSTGGRATSELTVSLTGDTGEGSFQISADGCTGMSLPKQTTCSVSVTFTAATSGSYSATLTVTSDQGDASGEVALSASVPAATGVTVAIRQGVPDGFQPAMSYSAMGGLTPATFELLGDDTHQYLNVPAGSYTVTAATIPTGFGLVGVSCTGGPGSSATTNLGEGSVTINAGTGDVTCTFSYMALQNPDD